MIDIEDPAALERYLRDTGRIAHGEPFESRVLAGGVSNRTVLVRRASGESLVLKQALEKLRVPVDWFCDPQRIEREAAGMRALANLAPPGSITTLLFSDPREHVLAMTAVPEPHDNWKSLLLAGTIDADHFRQFGSILNAIQLSPPVPEFRDREYFEVLRLEPYYSYTAQQLPEAAPFLTRLVERTRATSTSLVHGDFSPKNILVHSGRLVLLDHEVIHWGDPGFDVGFAMAHFLSKARHLPSHRDALLAGARVFLAQLERLPDYETSAVEHSLGCLLARVAGRSQLEYLSPAAKASQRAHVLERIAEPPPSMSHLIDAW